jgi:hypothetical protein
MLYKLGQVYCILGDKSSGYHFLREAIDHNYFCHACFIRDPRLISLHGEPPYDELINLARERHEAFHHKYF